MKKIIITVCLFFVLHTATAQTFADKLYFEIGYTNFNGNLAKVGSKYFIVPSRVSVGGSIYLGYLDDSFTVIPELSATAYLVNVEKSKHGLSPFARIGIAPRTFTPEIDLSILTLIELSAGYGQKMGETEHANTKGFRFNIGIAFPLSIKDMKIM
ncbi:hypothetical protein [Flavobacterium sp. '19STA2R22 D10 B1']|uniref:hypothetical protein n=1 Tax=Flavobacterium aerium TaxID=3037261 RepID=UPI00278BE240|nr:hypothetical protein [Flavobacterium sp. '19STA2R22 D10 B1']